jgi:hypothetical protein
MRVKEKGLHSRSTPSRFFKDHLRSFLNSLETSFVLKIIVEYMERPTQKGIKGCVMQYE